MSNTMTFEAETKVSVKPWSGWKARRGVVQGMGATELGTPTVRYLVTEQYDWVNMFWRKEATPFLAEVPASQVTAL